MNLHSAWTKTFALDSSFGSFPFLFRFFSHFFSIFFFFSFHICGISPLPNNASDVPQIVGTISETIRLAASMKSFAK